MARRFPSFYQSRDYSDKENLEKRDRDARRIA